MLHIKTKRYGRSYTLKDLKRIQGCGFKEMRKLIVQADLSERELTPKEKRHLLNIQHRKGLGIKDAPKNRYGRREYTPEEQARVLEFITNPEARKETK